MRTHSKRKKKLLVSPAVARSSARPLARSIAPSLDRAVARAPRAAALLVDDTAVRAPPLVR